MTRAGGSSVAIVGGGITGLMAAWTIVERSPETKVVILEASDRLGGQIRTLAVGGGTIEAGPDSFIARDDRFEYLWAQLGLENEFIAPAVFGAALWIDGRLRPFPPKSFWGLPIGPRAILSAPLSSRGKLRALAEIVVARKQSDGDEAVKDFVVSHFGPEVLERLVDPLLAGTRAGTVHDMSLDAALPQVAAVARANRSLTVGVARARRKGLLPTGPPAFRGIRGGMERLVHAFAQSLETKAEIRTGAPVETLRRTESGYEVALRSGDVERAHAVLVCTPAPRAAALLQALAPEVSPHLRHIEHVPVYSIAFVYPEDTFVPPPNTSGVLVPQRERSTISACTWWTVKWPGSVARRQVIRCFVGRAGRNFSPDDESALIEACLSDMARMFGITTSPADHSVTYWREGLPHYRVGHLERVEEIDRALTRHPGIVLAGASYRGSGLLDCIAGAEQAAQSVLAFTRADLSPPENERQ